MAAARRGWDLADFRDLPVIRPSGPQHMERMRARGLREAALYQVEPENRALLVRIEYPDGSTRINIWTRGKPDGE